MRWITLVALLACKPSAQSVDDLADRSVKLYSNSNVWIFRIHDDSARVTCWAMEGYNGRSGLSCLPDREVNK